MAFLILRIRASTETASRFDLDQFQTAFEGLRSICKATLESLLRWGFGNHSYKLLPFSNTLVGRKGAQGPDARLS